MRTGTLRKAARNVCILASMAALWSWGVAVLASSQTESAVANGDTRTLHLFHTHTGETIDATFRVNGQYDPTVLRQLNHFLRDWRNDDEHEMDPRLFDAVWEAYRTAGATDRIQIYSAYRSPETNAMLRRRSRAVAEHSQHMLGKAMDTTMPGFPMERIREAGMKLQHGGVGWYPSANFVHLDVGGVRSWPRMSYDQLAGIFPDGKTVHVAADGRTLPGYDAARMEIAERGGTEVPPAQQSESFMAWLFGGNQGASAAREDEEDRRAPTPAATAPAAVASIAPEAPPPAAAPPAAAPGALAYAEGGPAPAQPDLEGRVRIAPSTDPQKIATLEPADADKAIVADVALPMPPRRPTDLADTPDVPLPPVRPIDMVASVPMPPVRVADLDEAPTPVARDAAADPVEPTHTRPELPNLITRGTAPSAAAKGAALAFAAVESLAPAPEPMIHGLGLRSAAQDARRQFATEPATHVAAQQSVARDDDETPVVAGPKLTGLRKAARLAAEKAAL